MATSTCRAAYAPSSSTLTVSSASCPLSGIASRAFTGDATTIVTEHPQDHATLGPGRVSVAYATPSEGTDTLDVGRFGRENLASLDRLQPGGIRQDQLPAATGDQAGIDQLPEKAADRLS